MMSRYHEFFVPLYHRITLTEIPFYLERSQLDYLYY
jgi:hypothetical protein